MKTRADQGCECHSHNGFQLSPSGLAQQTSLEGLAPRGDLAYIDKVVSVSGLRRDETTMIFDDEVIEDQYRRFLDAVSEKSTTRSATA